MAQILGCSPFSPELLAHTEAQLDFILMKTAEEHPGSLVITRAGQEIGKPSARAWASREVAWDAVLQGKALAERHGDADLAELRAGIERVRRERGAVSGVGGLAARIQKGAVPGSNHRSR